MRFSVLGYGDVQCRHTSSVRFAEGLRGFNRPLVEDNPHTASENFGMGVGFDPPPPVPLQQQQHYIQVTSRYFRMHVSDTILDYRLYETYYNDRKVVEQLTGPTSINLSR